MKILLDFETRSEVDIRKSGAWIYSNHPSTKILCIGYAIEETSIHLIPKHKVGDMSSLMMNGLVDFAEDPSYIFNAHNAFFEQCIWKNILVKRHGFPPIPIKRWRCTAAKAAAYGLPRSLEGAAQAMNLDVQKDKIGYQIMLLMCKPLPRQKGEIVYNDEPKNYETLYKYCQRDVEVERRLDTILPDLSSLEQEIWFYDQLINVRGILVDMPTVHKFIEILNYKTDELNKQLTLLTEGAITKGTQAASMLKYLNAEGAKMTSIDQPSVLEAIASGRLNSKQIQVLRLRQQLGKSSLAKYKKLIYAVDEKNMLRECFLYCGASTGRWAGRIVQLHNLPINDPNMDMEKTVDTIAAHGYPAVEMMYPGKVTDKLSECIRGMFIPPKGNELLIVDYGAIEARILMWLSGEELGLKEFKNTDAGTDEDIYVKMAQKIYGNPNLTKKENKAERALGKQAILGCGYNMGRVKFVGTCAKYGIEVAEDEASRIVALYRSTYFNIVNFWHETERTMLEAFNTPGKVFMCKGIAWVYIKERNAIFCRLPSERILTYHQPEMHPNKFNKMGMTFMTEMQSKWVRRDTYGGLLVENITQAVARDIMAYSIPRLEVAGFPVLIHVHDEIVSHRPIGEGKISEMIRLMRILPKWAKGCPIVAEGFTNMRYKKG